MANPWLVAGLGKIALNKSVQGAAGAVGASRIYKGGKLVGAHQKRRTAAKSLKAAGIDRKTRKKVLDTTVKGPSTLGGQAAAVATSIPGSAAIGAAGVAGFGHWQNQKRDAKGRWTR